MAVATAARGRQGGAGVGGLDERGRLPPLPPGGLKVIIVFPHPSKKKLRCDRNRLEPSPCSPQLPTSAHAKSQCSTTHGNHCIAQNPSVKLLSSRRNSMGMWLLMACTPASMPRKFAHSTSRPWRARTPSYSPLTAPTTPPAVAALSILYARMQAMLKPIRNHSSIAHLARCLLNRLRPARRLQTSKWGADFHGRKRNEPKNVCFNVCKRIEM